MRAVSRAGVYLLLGAGAVSTLLPLVLLLSGALQGSELYQGRILPEALQWSNFATVWSEGRFYRYFGNSLLYGVLVLPASVLVSAMAAYGLARHRFPGRAATLVLALVMLMIPTSVIFIPLYSTLLDFGLVNTRAGYVLALVASTLPLNIFIQMRFFAAVPGEIEDAAVMDGASRWTVFYRIALPLVRPGVAVAGLLSLVTVWNEFTLALVLFRDQDLMPIQQGLVQFANAERPEQNLMLAASVLAVVPTVAVYVVAQRAITRGIMEGAVSG